MSKRVYFRRPDALDLEVLKTQCWQSWFSSHTMPTEIVEALIETVETQQKELTKAKLDAEIYEAMYDTTVARAETQLSGIREAVDWLWGFYDGNTLVAKSGYANEIQDAWVKLLMAIDTEDNK